MAGLVGTSPLDPWFVGSNPGRDKPLDISVPLNNVHKAGIHLFYEF